MSFELHAEFSSTLWDCSGLDEGWYARQNALHAYWRGWKFKFVAVKIPSLFLLRGVVMDTTEQLNGTYFYGGLSNLNAGELFFWIMVDVTAEHFTGAAVATGNVVAAAAIYAGRNNVAVSGKLANATPGTSYASIQSRRLLQKYRLPFPLPTIVGNPFNMKIIMTQKLGTFVGRTVPVIGWAVVASDVGVIGWKSMNRYNTIVRAEDKIW